jgi:hypothetical protein
MIERSFDDSRYRIAIGFGAVWWDSAGTRDEICRAIVMTAKAVAAECCVEQLKQKTIIYDVANRASASRERRLDEKVLAHSILTADPAGQLAALLRRSKRENTAASVLQRSLFRFGSVRFDRASDDGFDKHLLLFSCRSTSAARNADVR